MRKFLTAILAMALIGIATAPLPARAQLAPFQSKAVITNGATTADWDVPAATMGPLYSLQAINLTNGATLAVSHLVSYGNGAYATNTVETAASGGTLLCYPSAACFVCSNLTSIVTIKPRWLTTGDKLRFTVSAANGNTGVVTTVIIKAGFPGK